MDFWDSNKACCGAWFFVSKLVSSLNGVLYVLGEMCLSVKLVRNNNGIAEKSRTKPVCALMPL